MDFYRINEEYNRYLQRYEKEHSQEYVKTVLRKKF